MFTDPLSLTIAGTAHTLPRTNVGEDRAEYTSSNGLIEVKASHEYGKRTRRMIRVDVAELSPDVYKPTENVRKTMSVYTVFDIPVAGYDAAACLAVYTGFNAMLAAGSNLLVTRLLGGES